jgi:hypothetical protein
MRVGERFLAEFFLFGLMIILLSVWLFLAMLRVELSKYSLLEDFVDGMYFCLFFLVFLREGFGIIIDMFDRSYSVVSSILFDMSKEIVLGLIFGCRQEKYKVMI